MNFTSLRAVIRNIKSHVNCPQCDNSYSNDDITVVSCIGEKCAIIAQCDYCKTSILITASLSPQGANTTAMSTKNMKTDVEKLGAQEIVNSDDVMKVHEFLKTFKGNLGDMLQK
ncbi:MAG: hypothetical protein HY817_00170 [Candidatus Abawacabacteria bacterium]|nr:hypothetical protein [Candidatus Abawacabacteria bacterium]